MFIVPYYTEEPIQSKTNFKLWKAWVFLGNGGTSVWETDPGPIRSTQAVSDYLIPNGFSGKTVYNKEKDCLYMNISANTDFSDLHTWPEFLKEAKDIPNEFILRPLVWVGDGPGLVDEWGWKEQCEKVSLGKFGNLATLWDGLTASA